MDNDVVVFAQVMTVILASAAAATTMRTGRSGHDCANAGSVAGSKNTNATITITIAVPLPFLINVDNIKAREERNMIGNSTCPIIGRMLNR